jgi:hypothetical protein
LTSHEPSRLPLFSKMRSVLVSLRLVVFPAWLLLAADPEISFSVPLTTDGTAGIPSQLIPATSSDDDTFRSFASVVNTVPTAKETAAGGEDSAANNTPTKQCSIYLAPSSIPDGNTKLPVGFGIYTTRRIEKGGYIWRNGEGPSVVIPDVKLHYDHLLTTTNLVPPEGKIPPDLMPEWAQYIFLYPCVGFNTETNDPRMRKTNSLESNMNLGYV